MADIPIPNRVDLEDAIQAGILPTWTEVVALIQAIVSALDRSAPPFFVPNPSQVFVLSTGQIRIDGGRVHTRGAVVGVGQLLRLLLDRTPAPAELVEIFQLAQADPPAYASLREMQSALDSFARPDAQDELAAYYDRARHAIGSANTYDTVSATGEEAPIVERASEGWDDRLATTRRWIVSAIVALVSTIILAAAWNNGLEAWRWLRGQDRTAAAARVGSGGNAAGPTTTSPREARPDLAGNAERPAAPAPRAVPPKPAASAPRRVDARGSALPAVEAPSRPVPSPPSSPPTAAVAPELVGPTGSRTRGRAPQRVPLPDVPSPLARTDLQPVPLLQAVVYSASDADVGPPELVSPQLPKQRPKGIADEVAGGLELLVLEDGTVGEVRLVPPSQRIQDRMLLSASKAWRFRPAQRQGRPVKYRIRIPITW